MIKKLTVSTILVISSLFASSVNVDLSNVYSSNQNWSISMSNGGTYYVMLPADLELTTLQQSITTNDGIIYVYRWYQRSDLVEADFGQGADFALIKITKDSILYYVKENGSYLSPFNSFNDMKNYLQTAANNISNTSKRNIYINSYIPGFEKLLANRLYLIKPKNMDLTINIKFPSLTTTNINNDQNGTSDIPLPPQPPAIQ